MLLYRFELGRLAADNRALDHLARGDVHQIGQAGNVIQVSMCEKNFELIRRQISADAAHPAARIKHYARLGQQQASGMPPTVGEVATGTE
jgi:hypothetical protein